MGPIQRFNQTAANGGYGPQAIDVKDRQRRIPRLSATGYYSAASQLAVASSVTDRPSEAAAPPSKLAS